MVVGSKNIRGKYQRRSHVKAIEGPQWRREESEPPPARQRVLAACTRPRACELLRAWVQRANLMAACEELVSGGPPCVRSCACLLHRRDAVLDEERCKFPIFRNRRVRLSEANSPTAPTAHNERLGGRPLSISGCLRPLDDSVQSGRPPHCSLWAMVGLERWPLSHVSIHTTVGS